jgi:hypothetical protein
MIGEVAPMLRLTLRRPPPPPDESSSSAMS